MELFDPALAADPWPVFAAWRAAGPVHAVAGSDLLAVCGYEAALDVLRRPGDFSSAAANQALHRPPTAAGATWAGTVEVVPALLTADPPAHTRHRRLVQPAFTPRRIAHLEDVIRQRADELLDAVVDQGHVELIDDVAGPLPLLMIAEALGAEPDDLPRLEVWSDAVVARIGKDLEGDEEREVARLNRELREYLQEQVADRRAHPRDDLLTDVVTAAAGAEGATPLTLPETLTILEQLLVAGNETATRLITLAMWYLVRDPALLDQVDAARDTIPALLEEVLRLESPVQAKVRTATCDTAVAGVEIARGTRVVVLFAAANRDPAEFPDPDELRLDRPNGRSHLAFGYGPHFCVGANLARAEAAVAINRLLDRLPGVRLSDAHSRPSFEPSFVHRGLDALHLVFDPPGGGAQGGRSLGTTIGRGRMVMERR